VDDEDERAAVAAAPRPAEAALARRIGPFDATMIVMGGMIGSGIFVNPAVVARSVHSAALILGAWLVGGAAALLGALVYADLAASRPRVGGQYAYLREAYSPLAAFLYGWALLLVIQSGGMAATAIAFARYFRELVVGCSALRALPVAGEAGSSALQLSESALAAIALALLTIVNCLGVRAGSAVQSFLMVLKIGALLALVVCGFAFAQPSPAVSGPPSSISDFGAALIPVLFAYGGWQTACFVAGEMREPRRDLPRALLAGVCGVIALYSLVAFVCLRTLGPVGLAATGAPALDVMTRALGRSGGAAISAGIALSTLGFLSQSILTAPRVYFAMAEDGLFFRTVARVNKRTRVPAVAIALQGAVTVALALLGTYEAILRYVVAIDFIFFALTAGCLFVFRRERRAFAMPGHPVTTLAFIAVCAAVVIATFVADPLRSMAGLGLTLAGVPAYLLWQRRRRLRPRGAEAGGRSIR
jgi:APA family basic amino acid/polyamine antiporter